MRVKTLLQERNYSQYELFKRGGVPRSTLCDVVNAKKKRVSTDTIYQICATLGISLKDFFDDALFSDLDD
ncbi:MAG: helix-turn-helix transcriptional regulator [Clostridia bacterium]|nr:helix-turn-helix transcriptional regulator [Clostridia bacterium]